jgi:hypothetical protein
MIADKAYNSDQCEAAMRAWGTEMTLPNRSSRKRKTQYGRQSGCRGLAPDLEGEGEWPRYAEPESHSSTHGHNGG